MNKEEVILQTKDVKVRIIELQKGESGPFHFHTVIADNMFGISGEITVSMKNPLETTVLKPGVHCKIEPGRMHRVSNNLDNQPSKYLLVQGVGVYDFIKEND